MPFRRRPGRIRLFTDLPCVFRWKLPSIPGQSCHLLFRPNPSLFNTKVATLSQLCGTQKRRLISDIFSTLTSFLFMRFKKRFFPGYSNITLPEKTPYRSTMSVVFSHVDRPDGLMRFRAFGRGFTSIEWFIRSSFPPVGGVNVFSSTTPPSARFGASCERCDRRWHPRWSDLR